MKHVPKSPAHFKADKKAFTLLKGLVETHGLKLEGVEICHNFRKERRNFKLDLKVTRSTRNDEDTYPGIVLCINPPSKGITFAVDLTYESKRESWYVVCPSKKNHKGPAPKIGHLVNPCGGDKFLSEEQAYELTHLILDFYQNA